MLATGSTRRKATCSRLISARAIGSRHSATSSTAREKPEARAAEESVRCVAPGGTIAIAEFVPDDDRAGPPAPLIFAVNMLVNTELGDTFTFREISGWLAEAGFEQARQLEAPSVSPLILANRPRSG